MVDGPFGLEVYKINDRVVALELTGYGKNFLRACGVNVER